MQRSLTMVFHAVIPARFLSLTAHLVLNIMLFWSRVSGHLEITARVVIRAPRYWLPMATNIPGGYKLCRCTSMCTVVTPLSLIPRLPAMQAMETRGSDGWEQGTSAASTLNI